MKSRSLFAVPFILLFLSSSSPAQVVRSGTGATAADITVARDQFRLEQSGSADPARTGRARGLLFAISFPPHLSLAHRESLNEFVKRVRLERALAMMSRKIWKTKRHLSLTDIAFATGFNSSADFARSFKGRYGVLPSRFDIASYRANRREEWQVTVNGAKVHLLDRLKAGTNPDGFEVAIRHLPARGVAYMRVLDCFRPGAVFEVASRLIQWAEARGVADGQWLVLYVGQSGDNRQ